ncbi:MAG: nucleoside-triphosphatase [Elusimicrobiota bacterium]
MKNLVIAGNPGTGKTTLILEATLPFREIIGGFYTEEIHKSNQLWGFRIKSFDGQEGIFSHKGMESKIKLNKYGVDIEILETIAVSSMEEALHSKEIIVIDEIGAMECLSEKFSQVLIKCLNSPKRILAAIRRNSQPFTDQMKIFPQTRIIELTNDSFLDCKKKLRQWLEEK